mmetsp:Transcript_54916/g.170090  ORF Transcript_54916/g.170090 Transcript_54916/m.170090 type:complete len:95 (-) Transcript_54916:8-292(-)
MSPIFISRIIEDGVAAQQGDLQRGDMMLAVNGVSVVNQTHDFAVGLLKSAVGTVDLTVRSDIEALEELERKFAEKRASQRASAKKDKHSVAPTE